MCFGHIHPSPPLPAPPLSLPIQLCLFSKPIKSNLCCPCSLGCVAIYCLLAQCLAANTSSAGNRTSWPPLTSTLGFGLSWTFLGLGHAGMSFQLSGECRDGCEEGAEEEEAEGVPDSTPSSVYLGFWEPSYPDKQCPLSADTVLTPLPSCLVHEEKPSSTTWNTLDPWPCPQSWGNTGLYILFRFQNWPWPDKIVSKFTKGIVLLIKVGFYQVFFLLNEIFFSAHYCGRVDWLPNVNAASPG